MGILTHQAKSIFHPEEIEAFNAFRDKSSSKKPEEVRRQEVLKGVIKPLNNFYEEHLQFYLMEMNKNPILKGVLKGIVEGKFSIINVDIKSDTQRSTKISPMKCLDSSSRRESMETTRKASYSVTLTSIACSRNSSDKRSNKRKIKCHSLRISQVCSPRTWMMCSRQELYSLCWS